MWFLKNMKRHEKKFKLLVGILFEWKFWKEARRQFDGRKKDDQALIQRFIITYDDFCSHSAA